MTNKDLHLTLDDRLTGSRESGGGAAQACSRSGSKRQGPRVSAHLPIQSASGPNLESARPAISGGGTSFLWILSLFLGAANVAVLCAGGYWLYSQKLASPAVVPDATILQLQLAKLEGQLDGLQSAVDALDVRQQQLQFAGADERQQINRALLDVRQLIVPQQKESPAAKPASAATEPPSWQLTVKTLPSQSEALALKELLQAMAYAVEVQQVDVDGKIAYRVQLIGFSTREQAEQAAGKLMENMDINGLWVWKAD